MLDLVIEVMPEKFLNYLPVTVISNLLFISTYTRQIVYKKFEDIYYLSTGFTSEKNWFFIIQKAAQNICAVVLNQRFFDPFFFNYHFDYDENILHLTRKIQNRIIPVFSVHAFLKMYQIL